MVTPLVNYCLARCVGFLRPLPGWAGPCPSANAIWDCTRHRCYATIAKYQRGLINAPFRHTRRAPVRVPAGGPVQAPSDGVPLVSPVCYDAPEHSSRTKS
jgi:hypothetical protein